jgi:uncharacterized membrane protein (DUF485 family)
MNVWSWGEPLGLGAFILAIALTFAVFIWAAKTASEINNRRR